MVIKDHFCWMNTGGVGVGIVESEFHTQTNQFIYFRTFVGQLFQPPHNTPVFIQLNLILLT